MVKKIQNIKEINSLLGSELLKILILCIFMRQHRAFLIFFPLFFPFALKSCYDASFLFMTHNYWAKVCQLAHDCWSTTTSFPIKCLVFFVLWLNSNHIIDMTLSTVSRLERYTPFRAMVQCSSMLHLARRNGLIRIPWVAVFDPAHLPLLRKCS